MRATPVAINWHPGLPVYACESFLKRVGDEYGWLGGFDDSEELRCILPYTVVRKAFFSMVRFRVETIPLREDLNVQEEKSFLNSTVDYFRSIGKDIIIPATNNTIFRTYPDGAVAVPYGSFVIDLTQPEENLWSNLHSKHRNVVRNAIRKGVVIRSGLEYMDAAYSFVKETLTRSRLRFMNHKEFMRYIYSLDKNVNIFVCDYQGTLQGCAVIPFSSHSAYYAYGGSISQPITGAMNLLHWEAIRHFRSLGVRRYDFVGVRINPHKNSKQEGLMMFKERFGGQLVQGYMWKYSLRPLKYAAYSLAVRILKGGDIVDTEKNKMVDIKSIS